MSPAAIETPTAATVPGSSAVMPFPRVARAYLIEAKYESLRMLRSPAFGIPFLALPAGLYLLFGVLLFGDAIADKLR